MSTIESAIDINADASAVWSVLTDFPRYKDWNPFLTAVDGVATVGDIVTVHIKILGAPSVPVRAEIVTVRPQAELMWRSHFIATGLFDRDHVMRIARTEGGCTVTQVQTFGGPFAAFASLVTEQAVKSGLSDMNKALKARAEAGV
ncbi:SRPBCC domain-containing protein [Lichenihabitans psoromatis]|uniref:SRPBCC domain-containing protein n=1 Tax=Lichenihabitans psoromatis TaxID=2528642 RepID=UPI0010385D09|nr:SRPBCC domain-containing protein [Lichenihabitans psoromatis]